MCARTRNCYEQGDRARISSIYFVILVLSFFNSLVYTHFMNTLRVVVGSCCCTDYMYSPYFMLLQTTYAYTQLLSFHSHIHWLLCAKSLYTFIQSQIINLTKQQQQQQHRGNNVPCHVYIYVYNVCVPCTSFSSPCIVPCTQNTYEIMINTGINICSFLFFFRYISFSSIDFQWFLNSPPIQVKSMNGSHSDVEKYVEAHERHCYCNDDDVNDEMLRCCFWCYMVECDPG